MLFMDTPISGAPVATETPSAQPPASANSFSLSDYREQRAKGESPAPAVDAKPVVDEAPDPEVEADPELRDEIDKIEAPKENETPAEKAARTKRNKAAARKGWATRQANKVSRLERENEDLRRRATPPAGREQPPAVDARPAAPPKPETDPKPVLAEWIKKNPFEAFAAQHPDHPDPYAGWQQAFRDDVDAWKDRATVASQRQRDRDHTVRQANALYEREIAGPVRGKYADYDTTTSQMIDAIAGTWIDDEVGTFLQENPKVGGEVLYRMASSDAKAAQDAIKQGRQGFISFMADLRSRVTTEAAGAGKKAAPAPLVTDAPEPHTPVGGASMAGATFSVKGNEVDIHEFRRARAAGRLPAELR